VYAGTVYDTVFEESGSLYHNTPKPVYNDNGLYDTSPIASDILRYQLISHC